MAMNERMSRRAALRLAVVFGGGIALSREARAAKIEELKELKEDVEDLKYNDELVDQGPSAAESKLRAKKKAGTPEYVEEEKEVLVSSEKRFESMLENEKAEAERIRKQFSKK